MPQLDIFMFQNVIIFATIIFFILSYNIYIILIKIFKILKTRFLLKKTLLSTENWDITLYSGKNINNLNLLINELETRKYTI